MTLTNLGNVADARGDLAGAEDLHTRALAIGEMLAPTSPVVAASANNLGNVAFARGDLAAAEELFRRSPAIHERLAPGGLGVATCLHNLGNVAFDRGDLAAAKASYARSLAVRERLAPDSVDVAASLDNLGNVAEAGGDLAAAWDLHTKALRIEERLAPGGLGVATSFNNLGNVAGTRGDHASAEEFHGLSLALRERLAPDSLDVAMSLGNLGNAALNRGDLATAQDLFGGALTIQERLAPSSLNVARSLHNLGRVFRAAGNASASREHFCRAVHVLEGQTLRLGGTEETKAAFRAQHQFFYRDCMDSLLQSDQPGEAFHVLERSRARSLLEMLAERDLVFTGDLPEELGRDRKLTNAEYERIQSAIAKLHPQRDREEIDRLLGELRQRQEEIKAQVRKTSPHLAALQYPEPLDLEGVRAALDPGTVLLSYSVGSENTVLFVVQPAGAGAAGGTGLEVVTIQAGEERLRDSVQALRNLIGRRDGSGGEALVERAIEMYDLLVRPAEPWITASERVLISPDGPLHALPFAAPVRRPGEGEQGGSRAFLAEWKPLHVVVSATVYAELKRGWREVAGAPVSLAAFGDPSYPAVSGEKAEAFVDPAVRSAVRRGLDLPPLPSTREEVEGIAGLYPEAARTYLGGNATEERAKSVGKEVRYLHLACHGLLDERFPLDSALALTIPERPGAGQDNGLLQAWEIFERVRIDADLVALSACETALGKELGGEGLIGLTRAFQYAGARSILASLWSVSDQSTAY